MCIQACLGYFGLRAGFHFFTDGFKLLLIEMRVLLRAKEVQHAQVIQQVQYAVIWIQELDTAGGISVFDQFKGLVGEYSKKCAVHQEAVFQFQDVVDDLFASHLLHERFERNAGAYVRTSADLDADDIVILGNQ